MTKITVLNPYTGEWKPLGEGLTSVVHGLARRLRKRGFRVKTGIA